jgi:hypothetical protein
VICRSLPRWLRRVIGCWLTLGLLGIGAHISQAASHPRATRVELWRGGDDGLTVRLTDAVETAIRNSGWATLALGGESRTPRTVVMTIPTNVAWQPEGKRVRVIYQVTMAGPDGRELSSTSGSCYDDELSVCAATVVAELTKAAKSL